MNGLHDLLAKLHSIEEAAKTSDIPAAQRKAKGGDWKVSMKDLEAEEKEGKISHKDNLAKNNDTKNEEVEVEEEFELDEAGEWVPRKSMAQTSAEWQAAQAAKKPAPQQPAPDAQGGAGAADESMAAECGDMPAQGGEGKVELSMGDLIRLMNQMQKGQAPSVGHGDQPLMGDEVGEEFGNAMPGAEGPEVAPVAAVIPTGDDMHSKGAEAEKVNGGGNPLQTHLSELYAEIKARQLDELSTQTLSSYVKKRGAQLRGGSDDSDKIKGMNAALRKVKQNDANKSATLKEANQMARQLRK